MNVDADARAVPRSRRLVSATLAGIEPPLRALRADVALIAGELLTNALLHGKPPITLRVLTQGSGLRVEVADASPTTPTRGRPSSESFTGRGLAIVHSLAARWGCSPDGAGKVVWAELDAAAETSPPQPTERPPASPPPNTPVTGRHTTPPTQPHPPVAPAPAHYPVSIGDIPTDLLLAAKSHVDNLVREFTLASRGAASGESGAVPPHLAELITVVTTRFAAPREAIRRQALAAAAARRPRTTLELSLPLSAADAAEEYLVALDKADEYARAARLLTVETPPAHWAFRRWYISSIITQLRAAGSGQPPPAPPSFEEFLLRALAEVSTARRAAERGARLQAATAALASTTRPEQVAEVVLTEGVAALGANGGSLLVPLDGDLLAVPGAVGYPGELVAQLRAERRDAPLPAAEAIREGQAVWLESVAEDHARYPQLHQLEPTTVSLCALPLSVGAEVLGALRFSFDYPRLFGPEDREFAGALAAQTALALERARLIAAERQARERVTFLAAATTRLTARLDEGETLHQLAALFTPTLSEYAAVYLAESGTQPHLVAEAGTHANTPTDADTPAQGHLDPARVQAMRLALHHGQTIAIAGPAARGLSWPTAPANPDLPENGRPAAATTESGAILAVPLRLRSETAGVLGLSRPPGAAAFSADEQSLIQDVADRAAIALVHARQYQRERETALTLQRSLLPRRMPEIAGVAFAWRYLPAGAGSLVGGDWYDVLTLDDDTIALVIGDVMGRGIQAAATMGQLRASARAGTSAHLPAEAVLVQLDAAVSGLEQDQITTVAMAILDPAARQLRVASAGHLPPLIVPPHGEPQFVAVEPGPPLGAGLTGGHYAETAVPFAPGSILLLYTDGLVEDRHRSVDEGMAVLRSVAAGASGPEELCERALAALAHGSHDDDTALLAVSLTADAA
ncbi:protein serine phosphatase [Pseudofrankia sp. EUN1h]|nr:protein serine phosphatase [Pseudofrankia sp. EUN1h]